MRTVGSSALQLDDNVTSLDSVRQAALKIEDEMGVNEMLRKLLELPGDIRRQKDQVAAARQIVDEAKNELQLQEAILTTLVAEEKDPKTGKAMFSNAESRKAELLKRMSASSEYQQAANYLAESEAAHQAAQFDLDMMHDEFSAIRAAVRMQSERLGLLRAS